MTFITRLLVPRVQAEVLLQNQIHKGKSINSKELTFQGLIEIEHWLDVWEEQTREILLSIFDSPEIAEGFLRTAGLCRNGRSFEEKLTYIRERLKCKNYWLEDIKNRLFLYEESAETYIQILNRITARFWIL